MMGLGAAGLFVAVVVGAARGTTPVAILVFGGFVGLLFAGAAWWGWHMRCRYERATWVLAHTPAVPAAARTSIAEPDYVRLTVEPDTSAIEYMVPCALPHWALSLAEGTIVKAHIDPEPGGPIVIETDSGIIWPLLTSPCTRIANHAPPRSENPFDVLAQRLDEQGFVEPASWISTVSNAAYTSSSELLGDCGLAMKRVKAACWRHMDRESRRAYAAAAKAVRVAWPLMRL